MRSSSGSCASLGYSVWVGTQCPRDACMPRPYASSALAGLLRTEGKDTLSLSLLSINLAPVDTEWRGEAIQKACARVASTWLPGEEATPVRSSTAPGGERMHTHTRAMSSTCVRRGTPRLCNLCLRALLGFCIEGGSEPLAEVLLEQVYLDQDLHMLRRAVSAGGEGQPWLAVLERTPA